MYKRQGQQWFDVAGCGGVVEDDQDAPAGERRAVEGAAFAGVGRDLGGVDAEGEQEPDEDGARVGRGVVGAAQVGEELPVGEAFADLPGDVHGQGGLADAAHAVQRGDHDGAPAARGEAVEEGFDLFGAAGEVGQAGGELVGRLPGVGGGVGRVCGGGGGQQRGVLAQDAQLEFGRAAVVRWQRRPGVLVHGERLGLAARLVEGAHQDGGEPGPSGVFQGECLGLGRQVGAVAEFGVQLQLGLLGRDPLLGEAGPDGFGVRPGQAGERLADPQPLGAAQHLPDLLGRRVRVPQPPGLGQQLLPSGGVHLGVRRPERVAVADPHQRHPVRVVAGVRPERAAQPGDGELDGLARIGGRGPAPHPLDQDRDGHRPSGGLQQDGEHGPLLRPAQLQLLLPVPGPQRPQQSEPQPGSPQVTHVPSRKSSCAGIPPLPSGQRRPLAPAAYALSLIVHRNGGFEGGAVRLDFRVLGPLRARCDDREVELGRPQQRAVLAALLLSPGQLVPTERLVEGLWGEDDTSWPKDPVGQIGTHAHRLRRALGAPGLLVAAAGGYRLAVPRESVDLFRYEAAVADAVALRHQDPVRARELLTAALGAWEGGRVWEGGRALDGVPGAFAERARERLAAGRFAAVKALLDLDPRTRRTRRCTGCACWRCTGAAARRRLWWCTRSCGSGWTASWGWNRRPRWSSWPTGSGGDSRRCPCGGCPGPASCRRTSPTWSAGPGWRGRPNRSSGRRAARRWWGCRARRAAGPPRWRCTSPMLSRTPFRTASSTRAAVNRVPSWRPSCGPWASGPPTPPRSAS